MKGISSIIAIILILLITVSLAALLWLWLTGIATDLFNISGNQTQQIGETLTSMVRIESVDNNIVYVRNTGQSKLTNFFVTVNNFPVQFTADPSELEAGLVGRLNLTPILTGIKPTDNVIEVTTSYQASATGKISGFTGQVTQDSLPVPFAIVNVLSSGNLVAATSTDSNGNYVAYVSPGTYDLQASAGGETGDSTEQAIGLGQIKTVNIAIGGTIEPGPTTYELFVFGRGYTCNTPTASHRLYVNNVLRFTFDPCSTFSQTDFSWASFDVTNFVSSGINSFKIIDELTNWFNSNLNVGIDTDTPDGNSDIRQNGASLPGELMIYINACNNLGCIQYRSDDDERDSSVSLDYRDDWAIKRITIP